MRLAKSLPTAVCGTTTAVASSKSILFGLVSVMPGGTGQVADEAVCSIQAEDFDTLGTVGRFFMKQDQFATDAYRIFGTFNRNGSAHDAAFARGSIQKFLMRQVKLMDTCIKRLSQHPSGKNELRNSGADTALLMMYGHMLYTAGSYKNAIRMPSFPTLKEKN